mmetsp:Transcript_32428/g.56089  ORF Transcript_32428/g.56089 Transcript_32428/m.56089 type:complete len:272 (-) Transcript_32428:179-994(-)
METLRITKPAPHVALVALNRPTKLNAMNIQFFTELTQAFTALQADTDVRVVVLYAEGKAFSAGLDLAAVQTQLLELNSEDIGRKALKLQDFVKKLQDSNNVIEALDKPVIAVVHGLCVGGGVDLTSACDIRYAAEDARISLREIDVGIVADLGTLQRMPKIVGNDSWVRELTYTGRWADSQECLRNGFFSKVLPDRDAALQEALKTASIISEKSPLAILGAKRTLNYSRDRTVEEGLNYVKTLNGALLQSDDLRIAVTALLQKSKPIYPKL